MNRSIQTFRKNQNRKRLVTFWASWIGILLESERNKRNNFREKILLPYSFHFSKISFKVHHKKVSPNAKKNCVIQKKKISTKNEREWESNLFRFLSRFRDQKNFVFVLFWILLFVCVSVCIVMHASRKSRPCHHPASYRWKLKSLKLTLKILILVGVVVSFFRVIVVAMKVVQHLTQILHFSVHFSNQFFSCLFFTLCFCNDHMFVHECSKNYLVFSMRQITR